MQQIKEIMYGLRNSKRTPGLLKPSKKQGFSTTNILGEKNPHRQRANNGE